MRKKSIVIAALLSMLAGCSGEPEDENPIHDIKYRALAAAGVVVEKGAGKLC